MDTVNNVGNVVERRMNERTAGVSEKGWRVGEGDVEVESTCQRGWNGPLDVLEPDRFVLTPVKVRLLWVESLLRRIISPTGLTVSHDPTRQTRRLGHITSINQPNHPQPLPHSATGPFSLHIHNPPSCTFPLLLEKEPFSLYI